MKKKKLGTKHICFQCGCKFYDLAKPEPICPKCGANQTDAKKKTTVSVSRTSRADTALPSPRPRRRKPQEDDWEGPELAFEEEDPGDREPFDVDGLSLVEEDDLEESEDVENL